MRLATIDPAALGQDAHGHALNEPVSNPVGKPGIRGLLCRACNQGVGMMNDDPVRLERAAIYLRKSGL